jgi:hypothetical protein
MNLSNLLKRWSDWGKRLYPLSKTTQQTREETQAPQSHRDRAWRIEELVVLRNSI